MSEQNIDPNETGRKGGATATPASSVRVYDQPQRRANPLARIIPIVLALAALTYLLSRAMNRPESEPVRQPSVQQPDRSSSAPSGEMNPSGPRGETGNTGRSGVSNPPGPAGSGGGR